MEISKHTKQQHTGLNQRTIGSSGRAKVDIRLQRDGKLTNKAGPLYRHHAHCVPQDTPGRASPGPVEGTKRG